MARRLVKSASNGRLLGLARAFLQQFPETIAIVPGRLAGDSLASGGNGIAGARRSTLTQLAAGLARPAMAERGLTPLSTLGLEAVTASVAHTVAGEGLLKYFGPVATLPGFARALARTLSELRSAGIRPEELASRGPAAADLALLLARYQEELARRSLADLAAILGLAGSAARAAGLPLLLLETPLETRAHREFFEELSSGSPEVLIAVSPEVAESFGGDAEDLDTGRPDTKEPARSVEHLRRFVFEQAPPPCETQEGFEMFSAPGEGLEMAETARRIRKLAREGIAFDQMAILLRNPDRYQAATEEALRRAGVPAYFSRGTARPDPAGRAFLVLLKCAAENLPASSFAEYLSLGQVPAIENPEKWVAPADEILAAGEAEPSEPVAERTLSTPAGWEKLLVDAAVMKGRDRWARRLRGLEREFELRLEELEDEAQRAHVERQLERLRTLAGFALPVIGMLGELPKEAIWSTWLEALAPLARVALRNPDGVLAALAEFEPMGGVGPVSVEEVAQVLSERLRFLRPEPAQRRWGRVFVGSIDEARGCEFRVVFLPGLAEGLFPQRTLEDPLLLDEARAELSKDLPLRSHRNLEEREKLRLALAAASERFIASYPRMDAAEARARVPSFYALELPRALEGALPKLKEFEARTRESAAARLSWPAPKTSAEAIDDAEYDLARLGQERIGARYLMEANAHLARSLRTRYSRWRPSWKEADGLVTGHPAARAVLAENRLNARGWSPSALESFAVCPYKFALNGIFRLRPREDAAPLEELDPLTRGALFHEVQFDLLSELKGAGMLPLNGERLKPAMEAADRTLNRVAARYEEQLAPAVPRVWKSGMEDLRTDLRGWLQQMAQNDVAWQPLHFEYGFGLPARAGRDPASTEEEAELAEGVRLRGSIDLVEKHIRTGMLRVTDHKTGKAPEKIPAYTGGGKVLQPMLYSLAAEKLLDATVESGRLFYATQRGGYQQIGIAVSPRSRAFIAKLLANVDEAVGGGFLPPLPEKDACGICDYRTVCGPYEEQRAGRAKDRQDERLDGLHEIRGFL
jgi:ATP-dependent helicase/nuclease subunit B